MNGGLFTAMPFPPKLMLELLQTMLKDWVNRLKVGDHREKVLKSLLRPLLKKRGHCIVICKLWKIGFSILAF